MGMTNEFIKQLSLNDKKTLSQKALKTCEEVGELAKAILPFDSASGTHHRFVDKEKILEEIADVHLTNISIAYSLGFTDDEIMNMIHQKSLKWSQLQAKEDNIKFPLPYEIHITVNAVEMRDTILFDRKGFDVDLFRRFYQSIGVKPIVLDLETTDGDITDVMTSSKFFGDNRGSYEESQRIVSELEESGFEVLRTKIETVPWHPMAPQKTHDEIKIDGYESSYKAIDKMPKDCYFESHVGVIISPGEKEKLNNFVNITLKNCEILTFKLRGTAKLSQNFFKKSVDGGKFVNMLTYRCSSNTSYQIFKEEVDAICRALKAYDFTYEKVEVENVTAIGTVAP